MNTHEIVVIGAGYAGMMATARLAHRTRRMDVRITLINPSDRFVERLRMHQVVAGQELADRRIPEVLSGHGVEFRRGAATAIDPDNRSVTLDDGTSVHYDTLVYAIGSRTDTSNVPGAADHAWILDDPRRGREFSQRLAEVDEAGGTVTVVGGGLTGIEAATEIVESHPGVTVTLVSSAVPGSMMGTKARAHLDRALDRLGIERRIGTHVAKVLPDGVRLTDGDVLPSDLTLWTAGVRARPMAADAGIETDVRGLIVTDDTLRSVSHPEIYAVGDAAAIRQPWGQIHGTCQSAIPSGAHVGDTIARRLRGKDAKPFRFGYFHQPVSLGRRDAVIQFTNGDDTPKRWYLKGRAAIIYKESVSGSPLPMVKASRWLNVRVLLSTGGRAARDAR